MALRPPLYIVHVDIGVNKNNSFFFGACLGIDLKSFGLPLLRPYY